MRSRGIEGHVVQFAPSLSKESDGDVPFPRALRRSHLPKTSPPSLPIASHGNKAETRPRKKGERPGKREKENGVVDIDAMRPETND